MTFDALLQIFSGCPMAFALAGTMLKKQNKV
jgi:hypothetical protein